MDIDATLFLDSAEWLNELNLFSRKFPLKSIWCVLFLLKHLLLKKK